MQTETCRHGQLARSCGVCELENELIGEKQVNADLDAELRDMRERAEMLELAKERAIEEMEEQADRAEKAEAELADARAAIAILPEDVEPLPETPERARRTRAMRDVLTDPRVVNATKDEVPLGEQLERGAFAAKAAARLTVENATLEGRAESAERERDEARADADRIKAAGDYIEGQLLQALIRVERLEEALRWCSESDWVRGFYDRH